MLKIMNIVAFIVALFPLIFILILGIFLLIMAIAYFAESKPSAIYNCHQEGEYIIATPKKSCIGEPHGYFKIPKKYIQSCNVLSALNNPESVPNGIYMKVDTRDIYRRKSSTDKGFVNIQIQGLLGFKGHCGGVGANLVLKDLLKKSDKKIIDYKNFKYKLADVPSREIGYPSCSHGDTCEIAHLRDDNDTEANKARKKYDIFYKTNPDGSIKYSVYCYYWSEACIGRGSLLNGLYDYKVELGRFPRPNISKLTFELMDAIPDFVDSMFVHEGGLK